MSRIEYWYISGIPSIPHPRTHLQDVNLYKVDHIGPYNDPTRVAALHKVGVTNSKFRGLFLIWPLYYYHWCLSTTVTRQEPVNTIQCSWVGPPQCYAVQFWFLKNSRTHWRSTRMLPSGGNSRILNDWATWPPYAGKETTAGYYNHYYYLYH